MPPINLARAGPELYTGDLDVFQPYRTVRVDGQHRDFGLVPVVDLNGVVVWSNGGGPCSLHRLCPYLTKGMVGVLVAEVLYGGSVRPAVMEKEIVGRGGSERVVGMGVSFGRATNGRQTDKGWGRLAMENMLWKAL